MNKSQSESSQPEAKRLPSVFVIGASTTLLMGPYLKQMSEGLFEYSRKGMEPGLMAGQVAADHSTAQIAAAMANLDTPRAASAGDTARVLEYLSKLENSPGFHPDLTLMHVGLHDIKTDVTTGIRQISADQYTINIGLIADWFIKRKLRLVWMTCGPLDEQIHNQRSTAFHRYQRDVELCNQAIASLTKEKNIPVIDLACFTSTLGPLPSLFKDHIHFNDQTVRLQAAFVVGSLKALVN